MAKDGKSMASPKLRFPEFRGRWVEQKLGRFLTESRLPGNDGSVAKKLTVKLWGNGVFEKSETIKGSASTQYYKRKAGQFIYSKLDFLNQAFGIIPDHLDGFESTVDLPCFDVSAGLNPQFLLEYVQRKAFYKRFGEIADGGRKAKRIQVEAFLSFPIAIPEKAEEQQKIADCLTSLDELIAAQGRKVEALKTYKRGLMQQLFPREGETLPRLRFPEFRDLGQWEPYELGPYLVEHIERVPSGTALPIYSSTRTGLKLQKDYYDNRELANDGEYGVVPEGLFVYRHMSDDGAFKFNINRTGSKIAVSKEYPVFAVENMYPQFLLYLLNEGHEFKKFALAQKKGGTRTRLYLEVLRLCRVFLPSYAEQQRISDCFFSLDSQISSETARLDALETHKKGLMQQLFPAPGEA